MSEKENKYIEGVGWRYDTEHNMLRRMEAHDYQSRCIYMLTMSVTDRRPLLGSLHWKAPDGSDAYIEPTPLGREVERCWQNIPEHHPEVELLAFQLMPDHIHALLFVTRGHQQHLGHIVKGFKIGCTHAMWRLSEEGGSAPFSSAPPFSSASYNSPNSNHPSAPRPSLFSPGYQDSILKGKDQLEHMFRYIADNPRRLAIKRMNPELFRVVAQLTIGNRTFAAIGNRWLLERPIRMQVRCHNNSTPENLQLIAKQKAYFLERAETGGVIVSPCISAGEKEIAHAALDAQKPLIVILENGFPPMYKPPGKYFEACAEGLLLMLAPWPYHMEQKKITREQCLALNSIAHDLSTEPWSRELEDELRQTK